MKNVIAFLFVGVFCLFSSTFDAAKAQIKPTLLGIDMKFDKTDKPENPGGKEWRCVCKKGECKGAAWISFRSTCKWSEREDLDCTVASVNC